MGAGIPLQVSCDFGSSDLLTPDVPPSATYPVLDNYAPSNCTISGHDLVDDDERTMSRFFLRRICSAEMPLAGTFCQALVPGLILPTRLRCLRLWII